MIMTEQKEVAFEDWEAEFEEQQEPITEEHLPKEGNSTSANDPKYKESQEGNKSVEEVDCIEMLRTMTNEEFEKEYKDSKTSERKNQNSPAFLKTEKNFIELSSLVVNRLKKEAEDQPEKNVPENQLLIFFEEMLLYLYPKYQWENIQYAKQKLKIIKKDKKEEQIKVKKLKQKQQRLKRTQIKNQGIDDGHKKQKSKKQEGQGVQEKIQGSFHEQYM